MFNTMPINTPVAFFFFNRNKGKNSIIFMEPQKTIKGQINPEKNKAEGITDCNFKMYYKTIVYKALYYWCKDK